MNYQNSRNKSLILIFSLIVFVPLLIAQTNEKDSLINSNNNVFTLDQKESVLRADSFCKLKIKLNHSEDKVFRKICRACGYSTIYNSTIGLFLVLAPPSITKWPRDDKFHIPVMLDQYRRTFSQPPILDPDLFMVNYVGHPYQGSVYYNSLRSQGATIWQSALFTTFQSTAWEYLWEGGMEQPSIQDLIVTPVLGSLLGELSHRATLQMSKNGFRWYEKILTCVINPTYALNNGFKPAKRLDKVQY